MKTKRGTIDWNSTRDCLYTIQTINPGFTTENYLIGGSAAWFYKNLLQTEKDKDFLCPSYTEEEQAIWYFQTSKIGTRDSSRITERQKTFNEISDTAP